MQRHRSDLHKTKPGGSQTNPRLRVFLLSVAHRSRIGLLRIGFYVMMPPSSYRWRLWKLITGFILLGDSWCQLLIAGALGIISPSTALLPQLFTFASCRQTIVRLQRYFRQPLLRRISTPV
jgi:hypothetical protein